MNELRICDDDAVLDGCIQQTCRGQWVVCCKGDQLGPDGWGSYTYTYPTRDAAEQALAEWKVKHICWITSQQVNQYAKESFDAAKHCSLIHWRQIQAAGWRGYEIAYTKNVVAIYGHYCAFCQRYQYRLDGLRGKCPLQANCKGCIDEWEKIRECFNQGDANHWDEAVAAMIAKIEAAENPELPKKVDPPKPLIALPVHVVDIRIDDANGHCVCASLDAEMRQAICDFINGKGRK